MRIAIIVEGETEKVFLPHVRVFLENRVEKMPKLVPHRCDGRIPTKDKLRRVVEMLLGGENAADAVMALTDVYTGTHEFENAADAKVKMKLWVGQNDHFYPHVALHDFEAWLLPYWNTICEVAGSNRKAPAGSPESVNHTRPPAHFITEVFRTGAGKRRYIKTRDAN